MKWSVVLEAEGDRTLTIDDVVEFADAVAPVSGIASGVGSTYFGAKIVVEALDRVSAIEVAKVEFARAAAQAGLSSGLSSGPITEIDVISEAEDDELGYAE